MSTSYGLGFEPFPLLLGYELGDWLHLRTDDTPDALTLGSHMNGEVSEMCEVFDEYHEAPDSGGEDVDIDAKMGDMFHLLCRRLIDGADDCCEALSRFYHSLLVDYATDEKARTWLQSKGLYLPVVPFNENDEDEVSGLESFAEWLSDDYLNQLYDLFILKPGYTDDGKPCVYVHPGNRREVRLLLLANSWKDEPAYELVLWDFDSNEGAGGYTEGDSGYAQASGEWITDGFLNRYLDASGKTRYRIPREARRGLETYLGYWTKSYGTDPELDAEVEVLGNAENHDFHLDCEAVVCKAVVFVG